MNSELDKWTKYAKEGILVTVAGFILFIIGLIPYSITETNTNTLIGVQMELTTRPYGTVGSFLMIVGILGIIAGIISKIYYDNKLKIYGLQYTQLPYQQYYQPPQFRICPNCNLQVRNDTQFCPRCGTKI